MALSHSKKIESNVSYHQNTIEEFIENNPEERFDAITCLEMLEHVPSPEQIIKSCSSILKKGGDIFFSTINRNPKSYLFAIIGAEYILRWLPIGTHDWNKFIKPEELEKRIDDGYRFLAYSLDIRMLDVSCKNGIQHIKELKI